MTEREWAEIAGEVQAMWPGKGLTPEQARTAYRHIAAVRADHMRRSLDAFIAEGAEFPPGPAQLAARARKVDEPDAPTWPEAKDLLLGPRGVVRRFPASRDEEALATLPAVVADFARRVGLSNLRHMPSEDPDEGPVLLATWGKEYREHVARLAERGALGVGGPAGELEGETRALPAGFLGQ